MSLLAHQIMATTNCHCCTCIHDTCSGSTSLVLHLYIVEYTCFDVLVSQQGTWVAAGSVHFNVNQQWTHLCLKYPFIPNKALILACLIVNR